jgi:hydrogenase-4 component F
MARIRGAAGVLPLSGTALILGGLALAGAPPSALFATELSILGAGFERGQTLAASALLACLALIFVGLLYHLGGIALGARPTAIPKQREGPLAIALVAVPLFAVATLGLILPAPLAEPLRQMTAVLVGI